MEKSYINLKKLQEKNGEIEFEAEIPVDVLAENKLGALTEMASDFQLPGFRKGKVPNNVVREHVGEMELLERATNDALRNVMQEIVVDENLNAVGRPEVIITKMAPKNPVTFKIRYALFPDISLPDYKKIGKAIFERNDPTEVNDKEIEEAVKRIQQMIAPPAKEGTEAPLPALTDESVKHFGNFKSVEEFRTELRRQLAQEKEFGTKEGKRDEMIKEIVKNAKIKIPKMLVDQELYEYLQDRNDQLKNAGLSLEEYLKQTNKTAEALEKEERDLIENDIKTSFVMQEVRKKEAIVPEEKEVQIGIARLKLRYPERTEAVLRQTAEALAIQEKLFVILERSAHQEKTT